VSLEEEMADAVRTREEIEAEIDAARQRLAASVEGLINQVHPKAIVANTVSDARELAAGTFEQAKAQFVDERGTLRTERVALLAAAAGGALAFVLIVRSILRPR
jgi:predicted NBD/HSP70 family sugar kinase